MVGLHALLAESIVGNKEFYQPFCHVRLLALFRILGHRPYHFSCYECMWWGAKQKAPVWNAVERGFGAYDKWGRRLNSLLWVSAFLVFGVANSVHHLGCPRGFGERSKPRGRTWVPGRKRPRCVSSQAFFLIEGVSSLILVQNPRFNPVPLACVQAVGLYDRCPATSLPGCLLNTT